MYFKESFDSFWAILYQVTLIPNGVQRDSSAFSFCQGLLSVIRVRVFADPCFTAGNSTSFPTL